MSRVTGINELAATVGELIERRHPNGRLKYLEYRQVLERFLLNPSLNHL